MFYTLKNCPRYTKPYTIKTGDTLYKIAKEYRTTIRSLMFINPKINPENLIPGTQICIPDNFQKPPCPNGTYYTIKRGDTLYSIARRNRVTLQDLLSANRLINPYDIRVGQEICIPTQRINCPYEEVYTITEDDTLTKILVKYNISANSLVETNVGFEPEDLKLGTKLCIPPSKPYKECPGNKSYITQKGDTIVKIAEKYVVSTDDLLLYNPNMRPEDFEEKGIKICIPLEEVPV